MNGNRLRYHKGRLFTWLMTLALVFSSITISLPIAFSSFQNQTTPISLVLSSKIKQAALNTVTYNKKAICLAINKAPFIIQAHQTYLSLTCNQLNTVRFNHLARQFASLKITLQFQSCHIKTIPQSCGKRRINTLFS